MSFPSLSSRNYTYPTISSHAGHVDLFEVMIVFTVFSTNQKIGEQHPSGNFNQYLDFLIGRVGAASYIALLSDYTIHLWFASVRFV